MENFLFGAKDFYGVTFKATDDLLIGDRVIKKDEVIARFDNISIATIDENKREWKASGGYDNRTLVIWSETQSVNFSFSQGIFSKEQLSILNNSKLVKSNESIEELIPITQKLESDENSEIKLKYIPKDGTVFLYDIRTGQKINNFELDNNSIIIDTPYKDIIVDYYTKYNNEVITLQVGAPLTNGYIKVEGKTRLKDDNTGNIVTGIFEIPKMRLKTGLSIRLGTNSIPMVVNFQGEGLPVGTRGNKKVCNLRILSDDIDSDL